VGHSPDTQRPPTAIVKVCYQGLIWRIPSLDYNPHKTAAEFFSPHKLILYYFISYTTYPIITSYSSLCSLYSARPFPFSAAAAAAAAARPSARLCTLSAGPFHFSAAVCRAMRARDAARAASPLVCTGAAPPPPTPASPDPSPSALLVFNTAAQKLRIVVFGDRKRFLNDGRIPNPSAL
jgi:hypothetical protein